LLEESVDPACLLGPRALDQVNREPRRRLVQLRRRSRLFETLGNAGLLVLAIGAATVGLVVVSFPPVLSRDVLGYVAYGRVAGLLGLNPYTHGRDALAAAGDPTSAFLVWDTPLPYGPLWIMVASAISVAGDRLGGVWVEVLLHKFVAAVALIVGGTAAVSLRGCRPSSWLPIIVLNPLLLLEGPGAGHNDIVMTALLVASAQLTAARLLVGGALVLGCAVAIKPVAFAALPLLAWSLWRSGERLGRGTGIICMSAIPTVGLSLGFGGPALLVSNVMRRAGSGPPHIDAALPIGLVAVVAAVVILRGNPNDASRWLAAWVPLALGIAVSVMPLGFPWYVTWAMLPALALTGREAPVAIAASVVIGLQLTWRYAVAL